LDIRYPRGSRVALVGQFSSRARCAGGGAIEERRGGRGVVVNIAGGFHQIRRDLASRAAALAEREASRILLREKEMLSGMT
jgi:hypothetical protein